MSEYVRRFFGVLFRSQQTRATIDIRPQPLPVSAEEWQRYWQAKGLP